MTGGREEQDRRYNRERKRRERGGGGGGTVICPVLGCEAAPDRRRKMVEERGEETKQHVTGSYTAHYKTKQS